MALFKKSSEPAPPNKADEPQEHSEQQQVDREGISSSEDVVETDISPALEVQGGDQGAHVEDAFVEQEPARTSHRVEVEREGIIREGDENVERQGIEGENYTGVENI